MRSNEVISSVRLDRGTREPFSLLLAVEVSQGRSHVVTGENRVRVAIPEARGNDGNVANFVVCRVTAVRWRLKAEGQQQRDFPRTIAAIAVVPRV